MNLLSKFLAEILGTFVFLSVIITSVKIKSEYDLASAWIKISVGLGVAILLVGFISGGHLNPAVSFMMYLHNTLTATELGVYVIAQLIGAGLAFLYYRLLKANTKLFQ